MKRLVGGEKECPIDRQKESDGNVESLICNGCITQMLGVICQPGLSCRGRAALGEKNWTRCCHFLPPLTMVGHANINPHSCPVCLALLIASSGVLSSFWTVENWVEGQEKKVESVPSGLSLAMY